MRTVLGANSIGGCMKIYIDSDSRYPVYEFSTKKQHLWRGAIEIDAETAARWQKVLDDFEAVQAELEKLYEETE